MTEFPPLYTLDPLNRFSDRASDYVKYRPSYPPEAIDRILDGLGDSSQLVVADIGAGTGISSRLLAERGLQVWAIEPNPAMSEAAATHPQVQYRQATAEQTDLPSSSVDLVTCFQAFHWFEPEATLQEFHRILKPAGRVALVWNNRDRLDLFTEEYGELVRKASNKHPALDRITSLPPHPNFINVREYRFLSEQALDFAGLIGLSKSRSYVPQEGTDYEQLMIDLEGLHNRYADEQGFVYMKYETNVILAESRS